MDYFHFCKNQNIFLGSCNVSGYVPRINLEIRIAGFQLYEDILDQYSWSRAIPSNSSRKQLFQIDIAGYKERTRVHHMTLFILVVLLVSPFPYILNFQCVSPPLDNFLHLICILFTSLDTIFVRGAELFHGSIDRNERRIYTIHDRRRERVRE